MSLLARLRAAFGLDGPQAPPLPTARDRARRREAQVSAASTPIPPARDRGDLTLEDLDREAAALREQARRDTMARHPAGRSTTGYVREEPNGSRQRIRRADTDASSTADAVVAADSVSELTRDPGDFGGFNYSAPVPPAPVHYDPYPTYNSGSSSSDYGSSSSSSSSDSGSSSSSSSDSGSASSF